MENTLHLYDKGNYYKIDIQTNEMSDDQKDYAIVTTRKGLNLYCSHFECAKYVKNQFDNRYGGSWIVIIMPRGYGGSCFSYDTKCYIAFNIGEFYVSIFKPSR